MEKRVLVLDGSPRKVGRRGNKNLKGEDEEVGERMIRELFVEMRNKQTDPSLNRVIEGITVFSPFFL